MNKQATKQLNIKNIFFLITISGLFLMSNSTGYTADQAFPISPIFMLLSKGKCNENYVCQNFEVCGDPGNMALDNNCDGQVDEGCACMPGSNQACFKGDPIYRFEGGCYAGTQECTAAGSWGPCEGGVHSTDMCFVNDLSVCHAFSGRPFVPVNLKTGTGNFSLDAISESWTITCPVGTSPCPVASGSNPMDDFQPLVSGEYSITYNKITATGSDSCTYPFFVGAPGLRVELNWEWDDNLGPNTVDVDLHLHKPGDNNPWGGDKGNTVDCAWDNCTATDCAIIPGSSICPNWFNGVSPPDPVDWYLDPIFENNTCYFVPNGVGQEWQSTAQGCHNPRLDMDNVSCDPTVTDSQSYSFCNSENANIDYPPLNQWTRVGVHYYSSNSQIYDVHPEVNVFCDGQLAATLGSRGFYNPQTPVKFAPTDSPTLFWLVADVAFISDTCGERRRCVVKPLYSDSNARTPVLSTVLSVQSAFAPPYPVLP